METAAICSPARNWIAKPLGLKISHIHLEHPSRPQYGQTIQQAFICNKKQEANAAAKTRKKTKKKNENNNS